DKKLKAAGVTGISLFAIMFFGIALVEFMTRRVYTSEDVSRGLGIPLVGTLPLTDPGARRPLPGPDGRYPPTQMAFLEAIDALRTMLVHTAQTDGRRVLMVASAGSGEGKTSLATQLAASLARGWRNTLLIDADFRRPSAAHALGVREGAGLSAVLRG